MDVPDVLVSGNHENIRKWRRYKSLEATYKYRKDLLENATLTKEDIKSLGIENIEGHIQRIDENINTIGHEKADVFYVDKQVAKIKSLKYYGNADIVPSDASLFEFMTDDNTMTALVIRPSDRDHVEIEGDIVIPYEYHDVDKDKVYKVTELELNYYFASGSCFLPNTLKKIYKRRS